MAPAPSAITSASSSRWCLMHRKRSAARTRPSPIHRRRMSPSRQRLMFRVTCRSVPIRFSMQFVVAKKRFYFWDIGSECVLLTVTERPKAEWINQVDRVCVDVRIKIDSPLPSQWIFPQKSRQRRVIVPRPVVLQAGAVVLAPRVAHTNPYDTGTDKTPRPWTSTGARVLPRQDHEPGGRPGVTMSSTA